MSKYRKKNFLIQEVGNAEEISLLGTIANRIGLTVNFLGSLITEERLKGIKRQLSWQERLGHVLWKKTQNSSKFWFFEE